MLERILDQASALPGISAEATFAYERSQQALNEEVLKALAEDPVVIHLIGDKFKEEQPLLVSEHGRMMVIVFRFGNLEILARLLPRIYARYLRKGVDPRLYNQALRAWYQAVSSLLPAPLAHPIGQVYQWMMQNHRYWLALARSARDVLDLFQDVDWGAIQRRFVQHVLYGTYSQAVSLTEDVIAATGDLWNFYTLVLYRSLDQIEQLAARQCILCSVRHLAMAALERIMASLYLVFPRTEPRKPKLLVVPVVEFAQRLEAQISRDLYHLDGWDVEETEGMMSLDSFLWLVQQQQPHILNLIIGDPQKVPLIERMLKALRKEAGSIPMRILASGTAVGNYPELRKVLPADGFVGDALSAVALANRWWS